MSVRRDKRYGHWFYRKRVRTPDGRKVRIFGVPTADGLPETRAGAEEAERRAIARVLETGEAAKPVELERKEVPTIHDVLEDLPRDVAIKNKPSSVDAKEAMLPCHLLAAARSPAARSGHVRGDRGPQARAREEADHAGRGPEQARRRRADAVAEDDQQLPDACSGACSSVARKRGLIESCRRSSGSSRRQPEFDFLDFEEAERLLAAAAGRAGAR